jgi:hypothetical protein
MEFSAMLSYVLLLPLCSCVDICTVYRTLVGYAIQVLASLYMSLDSTGIPCLFMKKQFLVLRVSILCFLFWPYHFHLYAVL